MMYDMMPAEKLVLMPTTNSAYGSGGDDNECTEKSVLKPISQYAAQKVVVEAELMKHPNAVSLRLATVFGMSPRMRIDLLVNDFTYRALNDRVEFCLKAISNAITSMFAMFPKPLACIKTILLWLERSTTLECLMQIYQSSTCKVIAEQVDGFSFIEADQVQIRTSELHCFEREV